MLPRRQSLRMSRAPIRIADRRDRLTRRVPAVIEAPTSSQAAVAIVLAEREGDAHALLIQRAERDGDPWSGHMAFPGGRRELEETDLFLTAARETLEEVRIDLHRQAEAIGRLDDVRAQRDRPLDMLIRPFVRAAGELLLPRPNSREVSTTVWVPLSALRRPETAGFYRYPLAGQEMSFPAFVYQGFTIWGLTYRMLSALLEAVA